MGWKAKFVRRSGTEAVFFTRNKGEFSVAIGGGAHEAFGNIPEGSMVEVEARNNQIQAVRTLENRPMEGSGGGAPPSQAPRASNRETEFRIGFYASAKVVSTLKAGQDLSMAQLALDAVALMDQCESLMNQRLSSQAPAQAPQQGYSEDEIPW